MVIRPDRRSVLVWGARGFIGRHLVAHLLARGYDVRVLSRPSTEPRPPWSRSVDWMELDPTARAASFDRALHGIDTVFNLAGSSGAVASNNDPAESLASNCGLQLDFLAACARMPRAAHVVFASSRLVYAHAGREPVGEEAALGPLSMYAAHKLCIEHYHRIYAQREALSFTVCRISNPYGVDDAANGKGYGFINALVQRALARQPMILFGSGLQLRDYVYISDLVVGLRLCAERQEARNDTFNIGCGASVSMLAAATEIQHVLGGGPIEHRPWPKDYEAVESGDFVLDISKARALLGYAPRYSFTAGIGDMQRRALPAFAPSYPGAGIPSDGVAAAAELAADHIRTTTSQL